MNASLLIRADTSPPMGAGHLMRCLAMAETWLHAGGRVVLASTGLPPATRTRLDALGVENVILEVPPGSPRDAARVAMLAEEHDAAWIMVDGYQFNAAYQDALKAAGCRLLFVDDFGHAGRYAADLVLNQNLGARPDLYQEREPYTRLLLGPRFVLLRRQFLEWRREPRGSASIPCRILVTLGGSDPDNVTAKVLQALGGLPPELVRETVVIVGDSNPHTQWLAAQVATPGIRICRSVANMAEMMAEADLAIAAGGTTAWELAYMGVPMVLLALAENQVANGEQLQAAGVGRYLGWHTRVSADRIGEALATCAGAPDDRAEMARRGRALIDGWGCSRVWLYLNEDRLRLREAGPEDARCVWEWANAPEVRAASFSTDPIPWERHLAWFAARRQDPLCRTWVADGPAGRPVGQVRLDLRRDEAVISVSLDAAARGRNLGSLLIWTACRRLFAERPDATIVALIKPENTPSVRAFAKAGFLPAGERTERGGPALAFVVRREQVAP